MRSCMVRWSICAFICCSANLAASWSASSLAFRRSASKTRWFPSSILSRLASSLTSAQADQATRSSSSLVCLMANASWRFLCWSLSSRCRWSNSCCHCLRSSSCWRNNRCSEMYSCQALQTSCLWAMGFSKLSSETAWRSCWCFLISASCFSRCSSISFRSFSTSRELWSRAASRRHVATSERRNCTRALASFSNLTRSASCQVLKQTESLGFSPCTMRSNARRWPCSLMCRSFSFAHSRSNSSALLARPSSMHSLQDWKKTLSALGSSCSCPCPTMASAVLAIVCLRICFVTRKCSACSSFSRFSCRPPSMRHRQAPKQTARTLWAMSPFH
mmetsp:Transcript_96461/g.305996  ORF Transcript_96461/g.305996 Transcript_96461/m.305996 type:complete len:332 (-) Transcript_96461:280-1275(-)